MVDVADNLSEVYLIDTNEEGVGTAKSRFAEDYDIPFDEVNGSKIHGTGNGRNRAYTRVSGNECLVVCVHAP